MTSRTFLETYYDTQTYCLAHHGIMLRHRREQGKGVWQVTLPPESAVGPLTYAGPADVPPAPVTDVLCAFLRGQGVQPLLQVRIRQTGRHVYDLTGPLAEVRVDTLAVLEGRRSVRTLTDLVITPVTDDAGALQRLIQMLREAGATDAEPRPLLYQVLGFDLPQPLPEATADLPLAEHLRRVLQAQVQALLHADPGTRLGTDPEALHQMRVATRRLRAYLRAAGPVLMGEWPEALRAELAWLGSSLGPVRDLDVLLARLAAESATLEKPEQRALARMLTALEARRTQRCQHMLAALQSAQYTQLLSQLDTLCTTLAVTTTPITLPDMAARAFQRLRKAMQHIGPQPDDATLHRLRIYGKRARYAAELAEPRVGKPATRFLQHAKMFQDVLGEHQDAVVAEAHLLELLQRTRGTRAAFAVGRLVERFQTSRRAVRAALPEVWNALARRGRKAWTHVGERR